MGGGHNFHIFSSVFFFWQTNLKLIDKHEKLWGVRGHSPPEIFENLHAVGLMVVLVLFE